MIRAKPRPQSMTGAPFYFIAKLIYIDLILYPNYLAVFCWFGVLHIQVSATMVHRVQDRAPITPYALGIVLSGTVQGSLVTQ